MGDIKRKYRVKPENIKKLDTYLKVVEKENNKLKNRNHGRTHNNKSK